MIHNLWDNETVQESAMVRSPGTAPYRWILTTTKAPECGQTIYVVARAWFKDREDGSVGSFSHYSDRTGYDSRREATQAYVEAVGADFWAVSTLLGLDME